jgi:hypothetical protein
LNFSIPAWKLATGGDDYQTGEVIGEGVMEEEAA